MTSTSERAAAYALAAERDGTPEQAALARGLAADADVLAVVERVPEQRRQPVLVLAVARWLGAPRGPWSEVRTWLLDHADQVVAALAAKLTQTNDVRRHGAVSLGLALADPPGPVALLEIGASAGLGLHLDRYGWRSPAPAGGRDLRWGDPASPVQLDLALVEGPARTALEGTGVRLPAVVRRTGLDLAPVDVRDDEQVRWLDALLPAEATERRDLLARAVRVTREAPPALLAGDAVDALDDAVAAARAPGAQLVVVTTGVLVYLPGARRQVLTDALAALDATWVSYERTGALHAVPVPAGVDPADSAAFATLAVDGRPLAVGDAHGTRLRLVGG